MRSILLCLLAAAAVADPPCPERLFLRGFAHNADEPTGVADVDGDGDVDLVACTPNGKVWVAENEDGQRCHAGRVWAEEAFAAGASVAWGDFDGNGRAGFAVLMPDGRLLRGKPGADSFAVSSTPDFGAGRLLAADVDGDRLDDLLVVGDTVYLHTSQGEAGFAPARPWVEAAGQLVVGSFDAQPGADLVRLDGRLWLASGGAEPAAWQEMGEQEAAPAVAIDLDGDGRDVLWVGDTLLMLDEGLHRSPAGHTLADPPAEVFAGDGDGDGREELISFLRKGGRATLTRPCALGFAPWERWGTVPGWEAGTRAGVLATGLLVQHAEAKRAAWFPCRPDWSLEAVAERAPARPAPEAPAAGDAPAAAAVADFDGDGHADLCAPDGRVWTWLPALGRYLPTSASHPPGRVVGAADWSADGAPDLVAVDASGRVWVARGQARADSDGDLLSDREERLDVGSDPLRWDTDRDGLADGWEARGRFRGLRIDRLGADPLRRTLLLELDVDQGADMAKVDKAIVRLRKLFAACPRPNPDGSTGIDAVAMVDTRVPRGPGIPRFNRHQLRELYFTPRRAGVFHWMHLSASGGGGQANLMSDHGSCAGVLEATLPHELGHQLGLRHGGGVSRNAIPHYPSLMNYAYNYALDGKLDNITFSLGHLAAVEFDEHALVEAVAVPYADLRYLSNRPFRFRVEALSDTLTWVDWNFDGVRNDEPVAANINFVSGEGYGRRSFIDDDDTSEVQTRSVCDPLLLTVGDGLALLTIPADSAPVELRAYHPDRGWSSPRVLDVLVASHLTGAVRGDSIELFGTRVDGRVGQFRGSLDGPFRDLGSVPGSAGMWASAAADSAALYLLLARAGSRAPDAHELAVPMVPASDSSGAVLREERAGTWRERALPQVRSGVPCGLALDPLAGQLLIAGAQRSDGRLHLWRVGLDSLVLVADEPIGGPRGSDAASCRPAVVFQEGPGLPPEGRINVYHSGRFRPGSPNSFHMWRSFTIGDRAWRNRDGWKEEQMFNQWSYSTAGPGAALLGDKPVVVTRFWTHYSSKTRNDEVCIAFDGDGVVDRSLRDHDDWETVCERGLEQSILVVRTPRGEP